MTITAQRPSPDRDTSAVQVDHLFCARAVSGHSPSDGRYSPWSRWCLAVTCLSRGDPHDSAVVVEKSANGGAQRSVRQVVDASRVEVDS